MGGGPRGVSVLERICANARRTAPGGPVGVHIVDPYRPGAGKVWRTQQAEHLLMNTVASQVTLFTDDSVELEGPVVPGPSLHQWAVELPAGTYGPYDHATVAEARRLGPDTYPTRAFYGRYLEWVYRHIRRSAPTPVSVTAHRSRAVWLDDMAGGSGRQSVLLENGVRLDGLDAVVLTQGHVGERLTHTQARLAAFAAEHGLCYVPPANPADTDLSHIGAVEPVLLRGLGLNFFDYLTLLTTGRGGRFRRTGDSLRYEPSGAEPRLLAGSRRGVPHHARGENEKGPYGRHQPVVLTPSVIERLRKRAVREGGLDFRAELWPLIATEVETVYYSALLEAHGRGVVARRLRAQYPARADDPRERELLCAEFGIAPGERWNWARIAHPHLERSFTGPGDHRAWLLGHLRADLAEARSGNVRGPVKAAVDVLRDLRNEIRLLVDHGGLTGDSHRDHLDGWYTPLNAFLSIGPPASRVEEMIALIEAGVLDVLGPGLSAFADHGCRAFTARSARVPGSAVRATALIEARLPGTDLRRTADPLLQQLLARGECTPYRIPVGAQRPYETGGLAVTGRPYQLLDAAGRPHPRRFAFGVPTEGVHWVTAAGVRPGVNSVSLSDADAIARAALALAPAHLEAPAAVPSGGSPTTESGDEHG
ncbi:FAD/NAD(P)-binding protein [Streptomyces sp. MZ04]|nr:FAD/NAD(P)-binding protein [Streptomyces sp. MZ04]